MPLIAIDGPSGSGKSTLALALSERLGCPRLDTGAMYRAVALAVLLAQADLDDGSALAVIARDIDLVVNDRVILDHDDVTVAIRSPDVTAVASKVAANPAVREEMVRRQRAWIDEHGGGIVEGRDIASVVAPDADVKVYLTADASERRRRRAAELSQDDPKRGLSVVQSAMAERDARDTRRAISPLVVVPEAIVIDSTQRSVESIVEEVLALL